MNHAVISWLTAEAFAPAEGAVLGRTAARGAGFRIVSRPRIYRGQRQAGSCVVTVEADGKPEHALNPRLDLAKHSPTGFEWGYSGSGPAQLALALLCDALVDDERAIALYQRFKFAWVCSLRRYEPWLVTDAQVREIIDAIEHAGIARAGGC